MLPIHINVTVKTGGSEILPSLQSKKLVCHSRRQKGGHVWDAMYEKKELYLYRYWDLTNHVSFPYFCWLLI